MTPSEIAELESRLISTRLRFNMGYREEPFVNPDGPDAIEAIRKQAATIRELEDDRDQEIRTREATVELLAETEAKLKIATEALEDIGSQTMSMHFTIDGLARHGIRSANEALARMKDMGQ